MNILTLAGRLAADPEVRFTQSGLKVTSLRLAVNSYRSGQEDTMWWRVSVFGETSANIIKHLKKGSACLVVGEMRKPEIYTNKDGQPQLSLDMTAESVKFSPFGAGRQEEDGAQGGYQKQGQPVGVGAPAPQPQEDLSDDIPF